VSPRRPTTTHDLAELVNAYGRRITPALVDQQHGSAVASALGIWLLLAACASGARGEDRKELEEVLGCLAEEAAQHLRAFFDAPPSALQSGLALWVDERDMVPALLEWVATLPAQLETGGVPSQAEADDWTDRHTLGLIERFPLDITPLTRLVLTSVLATKVSWERSFEVVPAVDHLPASSPWRAQVTGVLLDEEPEALTMLASTEAAGVVAVHFAQASEDLAVVSVSADPDIVPGKVLMAAYEVADLCRRDALGSIACSLFDLSEGPGHSWNIVEQEVPSREDGGREEHITSAVLVAWSTESQWDLLTSASFGVPPALATLIRLIGPSVLGDVTKAVQVAKAAFSATGFEAAAVTTEALARFTTAPPRGRGLRRTARLCFDHPYAAVALAGSATDFQRARAGHADLYCLPLFSAWVQEPQEPDRSGGA